MFGMNRSVKKSNNPLVVCGILLNCRRNKGTNDDYGDG